MLLKQKDQEEQRMPDKAPLPVKMATSPVAMATALRVAVAVLLPQMAFGLSYAWIGLAPHVQLENRWSSFVIGAIYALTPLSAAVTLLFSGRLTAVFPPRRLCWMGVGVFITGLAVALAFPSEFTFLVFYAVLALGVGYGMTLAASLVAVAQVFPKYVGTAGGILTAAYALSAVAEVPVVNSLIVGHSWIDSLRIVGGVVAVITVLALSLMPALPKLQQRSSDGIVPLHLLKHPRLATAVLTTLLIAPLGTYATSQVGIYAQDLRLVAALATAAVMAVAIGNTVGRLVGGIASDHFGANYVLFAIVVVDSVAGILLWRASTGPILLVASTLVGLACGGLVGVIPRLAIDSVPDAFSAASGLLFAGFSLGGFIGPVLGTSLGGGALAWFVLGLFTMSGLVSLILHMRRAARYT